MTHHTLAIGLTHNTGVLLRSEALAAGIDDKALRRLIRTGALVRIRQGAYALQPMWDQADGVRRQELLTIAVLRQYGDHVALSHASAVVAYGMPTWGLDLSDVHLTHLEGGGRKTSKIVHHHGTCLVNDMSRWRGGWITSPTRTVLDVAMTARPEAAVVVASELLRQELTTMPAIVQLDATRAKWPHSLGTHVVIHLADGRYESVGEARSAYFFWAWGLPRPIPQWRVYRLNGSLLARVDFAWPKYRLFCEFDGRIKYTRLRREDETIEDVVMREKKREEMIHELTGWRMIRITWADLANPEATVARIRRLMALAA